MVDVLLADKGGKIGEAVERSLRSHRLSVAVFDDSAVANDEPGYVRNLRKTVLSCSPRVIIPIFKAEWLAKHRAEFMDITPAPSIPIASYEALSTLDDKVRCSGLAASLGIRQPRLYQDGELDAIDTWPVVFKRPRGLSGSSVYFPKNAKALRNLVRTSPEHLVMDFIEGYDISVDMIRWETPDGRVFHSAAAYRVLLPRRKGISYLRIGVRRPDLEEAALRLLEAVGYQGVAGLDFRIDRKTGKAYFLECNPRFSGGIRSTLAAGLDLPYLIWKAANGLELQAPAIRHFKISYDRP